MPSLPGTWNLLVCLDIVWTTHDKAVGCPHYTILHILSIAGPPLWLAWSNPLNLSLEPVAVSFSKLYLEALSSASLCSFSDVLLFFWFSFDFGSLVTLTLTFMSTQGKLHGFKVKVQICIRFATSAFEASFPFFSACNLRLNQEHCFLPFTFSLLQRMVSKCRRSQ